MLIGKPSDIPSSEITSESVFLKRRSFIQGTLLAAASTGIAGNVLAKEERILKPLNYKKSQSSGPAGFYTGETLTPYEDVKRYNNFYEFGTGKDDPSRYAHALTTDPWSITIEGEVDKPGTYQLEDVLNWVDLEERIYRLRCVEAWSMVIPWIGFPLADLLKKVQPNSKAKYVTFETLVRPREMRGQRRSFSSIIDWPYEEGLRMDEAMHPLTLMSVGLYGKELPNQNGAPIRLVVPWKYGFKSIKSIVKIRVTDRQPKTTWQQLAPREYGFYANVNPAVDHPRWSQKSERRLPSSLFSPNRVRTQPFNGYAEQVADLYKGMDLSRNY